MTDFFARNRRRAIKAAQRAYDGGSPTRDIWAVAVALFLTVGITGFGFGRHSVSLPDLSQQRARDIMVAVHRECAERFIEPLEKIKAGVGLITQAGARCASVGDIALEAAYAAGVDPVDRVMESAKEKARGAKP